MSRWPLIISRIFDPFVFILIVIALGATNLSNGSYLINLLPALTALGMFLGYFIYTLRRGLSSNYDVTNRNERQRLYVVGILLTLILVGYYWLFGEIKLAQYLLCFEILGIIFSIITTKWKISFHAGIQGYFVAIISFFYGNIGYWFILNIILIGWARVKGKYHTLSQVIMGGTLGVALGVFFLRTLIK